MSEDITKNNQISEKNLDKMRELVDVLNDASKAYYQESREIMTNQQYDALYDQLEALEKATGVVMANSPTINVGYEVLSDLIKEAHPERMLSLDKTKDPEQLVSWLGNQKGILSWKLDGLTIVLTYRDGKLYKAVTRGNGQVGEVVTNNAKTFINLPLNIDFKGELVLRGEAVISYDDFGLDCLKKDDMLKKGSDISKVYGDSGYVLATSDADSLLRIGDKVKIGAEELEIAGLLKYDPFSSDGLTHGEVTLIMSGETFIRLTGITGYFLISVQTTGNVTEEDVEAIRAAAGEDCVFSDRRDQNTSGTYRAFAACVYGFLFVITLVTVLNIVNGISMSVSARTKQYGAMRAVGMDGRQITKMIAAEAFTYALSGCAAGCAAGLFISKWLFDVLIAAHFAYAVWELPVNSLLVILLTVILAAVLAVWAPAGRIRKLSVTETIGEL